MGTDKAPADLRAALDEAYEAYWHGMHRVPSGFETKQCRRETPDAHRRHLIFAEGFRAALSRSSETSGTPDPMLGTPADGRHPDHGDCGQKPCPHIPKEPTDD